MPHLLIRAGLLEREYDGALVPPSAYSSVVSGGVELMVYGVGFR
ncbi:MAG: hypothetical protein VYD19_07880 [Myxococcota bacterium]|nr:hypothetical protein [Myxococcota bacterium]